VVVQDLRQRELRLHLVVALLHLFQAITDHMPLRGFRFWMSEVDSEKVK
jgi:hypothetical protein